MKKRNYLLILLLLVGLTTMGWGQTFLGKDGGLEGSATIDNDITYSVPQEGKWTKTKETITIANETTITRSGENALKISMTSETMKRVYTPQFTISASTSKWYVQFYRRSSSTSDTQEQCWGVIRNGTEMKTVTYKSVPSSDTWEKVTYAPTSTDEATTVAGVILTKAINAGGDVYIDDFCIYAATTVDNTAPNAPGSVTISNITQTTLDLSWSAPSGGTDDGGYMVVRYNTTPSADDDPNVNGIYTVNNTITVSNTGTVRYIGTETSFTDSDLSPNTTYYYKVYTYDKAHNYSTEGESSDTSLPVELQDFNAIPGNGKVTLSWITESETENLGFNLYRSVNKNDEFLMLNAELIAGHGSTSKRHEYSYVDRDVVNGVTYYYKLEDVDYAGKAKLHDKVVSATPTSKESDANINQFRLYPCFPNPFNPETTLRFELTEAARISVQIYDLLGNRITTLSDAAFQPGEHNLTWSGRDHQNRLVGTGIYFLKISGDRGISRTEKVIFLR